PRRGVWYRGRFSEAFWTIASVISMLISVVLLIALILVSRELFTLKELVEDQLIGGLYSNFVKMDQANITTLITVEDMIKVQDTIMVQDTIPVVFDLPLNQETTVVLTSNAKVNGAQVNLNGAWVPTDIVLRKGTELNIRLNMTVPVSQTIPVNLTVPVDLDVPVKLQVPVDIPLDQTELHEPFTGLQGVLRPYRELLGDLPSSWEETPVCTSRISFMCNWLTRANAAQP
ncbi:MAG TPA: hypothetical protein VLS48_01305, partial [Anaerolineales bacterium]|nr:hypothetical protein [Anaerolineales bacterium]